MLANLTIEQLQNRFFLEKCPFWFAYEANTKRKSIGRFRDDEPDSSPEDRLDYAWLQLEDLLSTFPYGKAEVVLKSSEQANTDKSPTYTVAWGEIPPMGGRGYHSPTSAASSQPGMAGAGNWQMIQFFLQQQNETTKALHASQMETLRLNMENQNLAAALEDNAAPSTQEMLLKEGIGVVKTWVASNAVRPAVMAGTMGQRTEEVPTMPAAATGGGQNDGFTIDGCVNITHAITNLWPEYPRMAIMNAFYHLATNHREFIGAQLQSYMNEQG